MTNNTDTIMDSAFKRLSLKEALTTKPKPLDFVLPGMLAGTVGALVAQGGAGKSWVALELAIAVSGGPDLLGMGVRPSGSVLYLPAEDPVPALEHRLFAVGQHLDDDACAALEADLEIVPLMGQSVDLLSTSWSSALERMADGKRLVIIDTLRRFHLGDENSGGDMSKLLGVLERLCGSTGASVLFLHHTAKAVALNGAGDQQQASRGSSVLVDNIRGGQWNLLGMSENDAKDYHVPPAERRNFSRLVQAKGNYGPSTSDVWLKRGDGGVLLPAEIVKGDNGGSKKDTEDKRGRRRGA